MKELFGNISTWITVALPALLAAFFYGYTKGKNVAAKTENKLNDAELEIEKRKNGELIDEKFNGMSDDDIINYYRKRPRPS